MRFSQLVGFFVLFSVILLFSNVFVHASFDSEISDSLSKVDNTANQASELINNNDVRNEFLKEKWMSILNNSNFGRRIILVNDYLKEHKQIFSVFLGVNYEVSSKFFVAFFVWLFLILFLIEINQAFSFVLTFYFFKLFNSTEDSVKRSINLFKFRFRFPAFLVFLFSIFIVSLVRLPLGISILINSSLDSNESFIWKVVSFLIMLSVFALLIYLLKFLKVVKQEILDNLKKEVFEERISSIEKSNLNREKKDVESIISSSEDGSKSQKLVEKEDLDEETRQEAKDDFEGLAD